MFNKNQEKKEEKEEIKMEEIYLKYLKTNKNYKMKPILERIHNKTTLILHINQTIQH